MVRHQDNFRCIIMALIMAVLCCCASIGCFKYRLYMEGTYSNEGKKFLKHVDLSTIRVVADVPSIEIDATK